MNKNIDSGSKPQHGEWVMGFDEDEKQFKIVRYCSSSNRFFENFHGAVYPLLRMHKWERLKKSDEVAA